MVKDINEILKKFPQKNLIVIGDIIVDQYVFSEALGKSTESPTLVIKELETENYLGGAGIVARHLKALGAKVSLIGSIGDDIVGGYVHQVLKDEEINDLTVCSFEKPTTLKKRFIADGYKLLRTSILDDNYVKPSVEKIFIDCLKNKVKTEKIDGIIVSDFNYGVVTPTILKEVKTIAKKNKIKLFGDTQSSSQIGDFKQYQDYDLITPNLKEAHIALGEEHATPEKTATRLLKKTKAKNIFLTLGKNGLLSLNYLDGISKLPALSNSGKEKMGTGDSLLASASLAFCCGANFKQASFIGSCMASVKLNTTGNIPISIGELKKAIRRYKKWQN